MSSAPRSDDPFVRLCAVRRMSAILTVRFVLLDVDFQHHTPQRTCAERDFVKNSYAPPNSGGPIDDAFAPPNGM